MPPFFWDGAEKWGTPGVGGKNAPARIAGVREGNFDAAGNPKRLPAEPLPKAAPMSAPLPCCRSTSTTMPTAARMWNTRTNVCILLSDLSVGAGRVPDRHEFFRHQRRPADDTAVHVRHREQFR